MGYEGVFVRNIAPESLAAQEGTLKVGDRIWSIQGHQLALDESPANVVRKLKDMNGQLEIQVKRK
jgi:C-terminal processing protease CtpA/Prc